ncbi:MAG: type I methionyl aminopeptidase [Oscillospiraceae bacterium]|nr:type I methionyl aminopeptidase [Oscillospiraceae bacterium]
MISIKSPREIEIMRRAGRIAARARSIAKDMTAVGVTTGEIDREVRTYIEKSEAVPSFLRYGGFPAGSCISINEEVIHGIPGDRRVNEGDIVSFDVGAFYKGYHGDCADSFIAGKGSVQAKMLIEITRMSFFEGIKFARSGCRISDISNAIQVFAERHGFSVVREFVGHGIGADLHEEPVIPNFGKPGHGPRLLPGMTLAIEPMVNAGAAGVLVAGDDWTVVTRDGSLSAHYENTVLVTDGEPEILTLREGSP